MKDQTNKKEGKYNGEVAFSGLHRNGQVGGINLKQNIVLGEGKVSRRIEVAFSGWYSDVRG